MCGLQEWRCESLFYAPFQQWVCVMGQTRRFNLHNSPERQNYYYPHFAAEEMRLSKVQWFIPNHTGSKWWDHMSKWDLSDLKPDFAWLKIVFCCCQLLPLLLSFPFVGTQSILPLKINSKCSVISKIILWSYALVWESRWFPLTARARLHTWLLHWIAWWCILPVRSLAASPHSTPHRFCFLPISYIGHLIQSCLEFTKI